jgi:hypothetical protein
LYNTSLHDGHLDQSPSGTDFFASRRALIFGGTSF